MFSLIPYSCFGGDIGQNELYTDRTVAERSRFAPFSADIRTDIIDRGGEYVLEAELPGFRREDISVTVDGDYLSISAERRRDKADSSDRYVYCERSYGSWTRGFHISGIDTDGISVKLESGLLRVILPKKSTENYQQRQVKID